MISPRLPLLPLSSHVAWEENSQIFNQSNNVYLFCTVAHFFELVMLPWQPGCWVSDIFFCSRSHKICQICLFTPNYFYQLDLPALCCNINTPLLISIPFMSEMANPNTKSLVYSTDNNVQFCIFSQDKKKTTLISWRNDWDQLLFAKFTLQPVVVMILISTWLFASLKH